MVDSANNDVESSPNSSIPSVICKVGESDTDTSVGSNNHPDSSDQEEAAVFPSGYDQKVGVESLSDTPKSKRNSFTAEDNVEFPAKKNKRKSTDRLEEIEIGTDNEEYEMVLIKKPIELSIDNLRSLNLFKLAKKEKQFSIDSDSGNFVPSLTKTKKMLYIPCPKFVTEEDKFFSPTGSITQTITIRRAHDQEPEDTSFRIRSIRKKPSLKLDHLKQRLRPFGKTSKRVKREV